MQMRRVLSGVVVCLSAAAGVTAQEATGYVFATYYRCDEAKEARADAIFKETLTPLLDKQVKAGTLAGYGWGRHWLGGGWRRMGYMTGTSLDKMVDARSAYFAELEAQHKAAGDEFAAACSGHDDYLWRVAAASQPADAVGRNRAAVGVSTYFECDPSREDEVDAIVKTAFAPIMSQHVKDGKISSWSWLAHVVGGRARRVLVIDAANHKAALGYWSGLSGALAQAQPGLSTRFSEICSAHSDYIWELGAN